MKNDRVYGYTIKSSNNDINIPNNATFWHYTSFDTAETILKNKSFKLGRISCSNDIEERNRLNEKSSKVYTTCFSFNRVERVSMRFLYAGLDQGIALGLKSTGMKTLLNEGKVFAYKITSKDKNNKGEEDKIYLNKKDITLKYNWINYGTSSKNNYKYRNKYTEEEIDNNCIFLKEFPWETEHEFRIAVELKKKMKDVDYSSLYIEFNCSILDKFRIKFGPLLSKESTQKYEMRLDELNFNGDISYSNINYHIDIISKNKNTILNRLVEMKINGEDEEYINKLLDALSRDSKKRIQIKIKKSNTENIKNIKTTRNNNV